MDNPTGEECDRWNWRRVPVQISFGNVNMRKIGDGRCHLNEKWQEYSSTVELEGPRYFIVLKTKIYGSKKN